MFTNAMLASTSRRLCTSSSLRSASMRRASLSGTAKPQTRSAKATLSHQERTAAEPREKDIYTATIAKVTTVNDRIKRFRFDIKDTKGFNFHSGQWLDVFVPGVVKAGGFTITSSPLEALPQSDTEHTPHFELAISKSPSNPPAAWLWQPVEDIQGKEVKVRAGGRFVWPPPGIELKKIKRVVFIAGGVGINPMMSMLSYIHHSYPHLEARILYSTKVPSRETQPSEVLFLPEILDLFRIPHSQSTRDRVELFFTGTWDGSDMGTKNEAPINPLMALTLPKIDTDTEVPVLAWTHRIDETALSNAVGDRTQARQSVFYVCGPPDMTDEIVKFLKEQEHVILDRVLCEKWW